MRTEMFKAFCIRLKEELDKRINGSIFVESHPKANCVLVKIKSNGFFWTRLIYDVEEGLSSDPKYKETITAEVIKYFKRDVFSLYIKDYDKSKPYIEATLINY